MFIFKPSYFKSKDFVSTYFGQLLLVFIGATVSIVFTMGVDKLVKKNEQKKNRRLSAMMGMSNIESFARTLDEHAEIMASNDSVAT